MTQRHTETEGARGKRPQYKTPPVRSSWSEGKGFTPQESAWWGRPLGDPTFPPAARQPGRRPHGQRQTDRLTDALQQERIAFFFIQSNTQDKQAEKEKETYNNKSHQSGRRSEGVEDRERMNETWRWRFVLGVLDAGVKRDRDEEMDGRWTSEGTFF